MGFLGISKVFFLCVLIIHELISFLCLCNARNCVARSTKERTDWMCKKKRTEKIQIHSHFILSPPLLGAAARDYAHPLNENCRWAPMEKMEPFHFQMPCLHTGGISMDNMKSFRWFKDSRELWTLNTHTASQQCGANRANRALSTVRDTRENQRQMERSSKPINNIFLLAWTHKKKTKKNQNFSFHFYSNTQRNLHTKKWEFSLLCVIGPMGSLKCLITCKRGEENTQWERRRTMSSGWGGWRDQSWHRQMKTQSRKKYTVRIPQPTTSSSSVIPLYVFTSNDSPVRVEENMETRRMTTKTFLNNFFP